jgi:hypothetical protein
MLTGANKEILYVLKCDYYLHCELLRKGRQG